VNSRKRSASGYTSSFRLGLKSHPKTNFGVIVGTPNRSDIKTALRIKGSSGAPRENTAQRLHGLRLHSFALLGWGGSAARGQASVIAAFPPVRPHPPLTAEALKTPDGSVVRAVAPHRSSIWHWPRARPS